MHAGGSLMTTYSKSSLKTFFQTGDVPDGNDYANFIDSYVNIVDTGDQSLSSRLTATEFNAPIVSGANATFTGTLTGVNASFTGTMRIAGIASAGSIICDTINVSGAVSAGSLNVTGDILAATGRITASAATITNGVLQGVGVVSAAGTTQATAAILTNVINRGKGIVDGSTTGFAPPANKAGLTQYLFNEGASANLWPPTGGFINGLAVNVPFPLVASAMVTIVHLTTSAYGVK